MSHTVLLRFLNVLNTVSHTMFCVLQNPVLLTALGFLRSLPASKKFALCGMLGVSVLQAVGIVMITLKLLFAPPGAVVSSAPFILLSIMMGVIIQVWGVTSGWGVTAGCDRRGGV